MPRPRNSILSLDVTPYYHCTSKCVRGSFLCGVDKTTGSDYTHRRKWLRDRLLFLSSIFSIKIAAFSIMENHYHVVLFVNKNAADKWSTREVIERWHKIFKGNRLSQKYLSEESINKQDEETLRLEVDTWRKNLCSVSWFMRCTKEPLARMANKEDQCKGRFWDGRFHCQALLDKKSLLACMAYVDLNPFRAQMCKFPEEDKYTSLKIRIESSKRSKSDRKRSLNFITGETKSPEIPETPSIPLSIGEYLHVVDTTARVYRSDKRGTLSTNEKSIFRRLGFNAEQWISAATRFNKYFHTFVGNRSSLLKAIDATGQSTVWGIRNCESLLGT